MLRIDGGFGEGGGQILRSALSLSLVTGKPFELINIRKNRSKPGLMRQHLACVLAAARICSAYVEGADLGSGRLVFEPNSVNHGVYQFDIGSAGSTNLVLQTLIPALMMKVGKSELSVSGGTHNMLSPPFDFIQKTFLPCLSRLGLRSEIKLVQHGFFPSGGGKVNLNIEGVSKLNHVEFIQRGAKKGVLARALHSKLPEHIGQRELHICSERLGPIQVRSEHVKSRGPGNVLLVEAEFENVNLVIAAFGKLGVRAEKLALDCVEQVQSYLDSAAFADEYLADQLLLPMAIAGGGTFSQTIPSLHFKTNAQLIQQFLGVEIHTKREGALWVTTISN